MIEVLRFGGLTTDDEWRPGLVNEDVVHFVHDRKGVATLCPSFEFGDHVVSQVVEAELVVRAVGDVGGVRLPACDGAQARGALFAADEFSVVEVRGVVGDDAERDAEKGEERAHPLRVASRQVVVDGDDVYAVAREGVCGSGEWSNERLPFARAHLGDLSLMKDDCAEDLYVVRTQTDRAFRRLASGGQDLREHFFKSPLLIIAASRS